ncbi:MAG: tyrosine-type recombinase/integrase [Desulfobacula sp.]|uniref:tyrosine-type recombinase/integrase n=1 Tax=Desulfobacula sp. TaxID=2593537 RepID=UPI001D255D7C|nr:tyrosine-type recombinase/integrase [Desulfobacula sp.]MBT3485698.1 tyrosine-type recombinase/integrase [Desulfobacula sp.]MBT3804872.1 tyrosine-type recombinase/integrase [Desulfobacula sp.]MBT4026596.1 tyrosine-type recombinase/integrase [Desulfobacula sp.]MBT4200429.1 tyrosine-type recombinase/integrase [Desulfobacula sp.]
MRRCSDGKKKKAFVGEFKEMLEDFIKQKRSLGYKYIVERDRLRRFSEYTVHCGSEHKFLSKELVSGWTAKRKNESVKTWLHRSSDLRQFALYLQSQGHEAFIPPKNHKVRRMEYIPYIFAHEEIDCFFQAVDTISPTSRSNSHEIYPLLFRLLYCCGFRISEICHLKISDVDFDIGVLFIRGSKFNRDRLVPVSIPLANMVIEYHALFNKNIPSENYFFRNKKGSSLTRDLVYKVYRQLLWKARISHGGKGKGPRLHDFRHAFCVHTLANQVKGGVDLYVTLPILSVYVGHNSVGATQRYLRLTAEAYPYLIKKVSRTCAYVIPEEVQDETN